MTKSKADNSKSPDLGELDEWPLEKKKRPKTSSELRSEATRARIASKTKPAARQQPDTGRQMPVNHWARGRTHDPLVVAFVAEHQRQRTVKRTATEWMALFVGWVKQPR